MGTKNSKYRKNREAFTEIFDEQGVYFNINSFKNEVTFDVIVNFYHDVEKAIHDSLPKKLATKFFRHLEGEKIKFTTKQIETLWQKLGSMLLIRKISPIKRYFK